MNSEDEKKLLDKLHHTEPRPPGVEAKLANHHWLEIFDSDGHYFGIVVLQWAPGAQRWCHSGNLATGMYVDASCYKYVCLCPLPTPY